MVSVVVSLAITRRLPSVSLSIPTKRILAVIKKAIRVNKEFTEGEKTKNSPRRVNEEFTGSQHPAPLQTEVGAPLRPLAPLRPRIIGLAACKRTSCRRKLGCTNLD